jgi:hypothetical protein
VIRENRYHVIKSKDACAALNEDELAILSILDRKITKHRIGLGKTQLMAVVVEHDWPEYEPTWEAIEKRVEANG